MLYVWTGTWRQDIPAEAVNGALARRATWSYPDGAEIIGEWWRPGATDPAIVVVFKADSYAPILEMSLVWGDVLNIQCPRGDRGGWVGHGSADTPEDAGLRAARAVRRTGSPE